MNTEETKSKNIEIEYSDYEGMTIAFYNKGISLILMRDEAKELLTVLIEGLTE